MWDQLIERCLKDDQAAQREVYDRLKGRFFVLCQRYSRDREEAKDLLQEGFIVLFRDLSQFRGSGHFEGWARRLFINVCLQHIRKNKNQWMEFDDLEDVEIPEQATQEDIMEKQEMAKKMITILQQMPEGFRTVFNLYILEEYSHQEIADMLGISVNTSKTQLLRARLHFKKVWDKTLIAG